nr:phospholipase-like protein [Tanacetum cinerariifolium]
MNSVWTKGDFVGLVFGIKDEQLFNESSNEYAARVCLLISLEVVFMGRLLVDVIEDTHMRLVENIEEWNVFPWEEFISTIFELKSDWYIGFRDLFMAYIPMNPPIQYNDLYKDYLKKLSAARKRAKIATTDLPMENLDFLQYFLNMGKDLCAELKNDFNELIGSPLYGICPSIQDNDFDDDVIKASSYAMAKKDRDYNNLSDQDMAQFLKDVKPWFEELSRPNWATDRVHITYDFDVFLSRWGPLRCRFPWCKDVPKPSKERTAEARWAMVGANFVQILLQDSIPVWSADGSWYKVAWRDVDQVFMSINEIEMHWCLTQLDLPSGVVTFDDSGPTHDIEWHDWYILLRECLQDQ